MGIFSGLGIFSGNQKDIINWKQEKGNKTLIYRYPNDDGYIQLGSMLIVDKNQVAIIAVGDTPLDTFIQGSYKISRSTLPTFLKVTEVNIDNIDRIKADIYFFNVENVIALRWESESVNGKYFIKVSEPRHFLQQVLVEDGINIIDKLKENLQATLMQNLRAFIKQHNFSEEELLKSKSLVRYLSRETNIIFSQYGLELSDILLSSLSIKDFSNNVVKKNIKKNEKVQAESKESKKTKSNLSDTIKKASKKEESVQIEKKQEAAKPKIYYVMIHGERVGPHHVDEIYDLLDEQIIDLDTMIWHKGMPRWETISEQKEFNIKKYLPTLE